MKRQKWFRRMRPYVGRHLLGIGTAAVVVVTLCVNSDCTQFAGVREYA
jgi:hypothetical protein